MVGVLERACAESRRPRPWDEGDIRGLSVATCTCRCELEGELRACVVTVTSDVPSAHSSCAVAAATTRSVYIRDVLGALKIYNALTSGGLNWPVAWQRIVRALLFNFPFCYNIFSKFHIWCGVFNVSEKVRYLCVYLFSVLQCTRQLLRQSRCPSRVPSGQSSQIYNHKACYAFKLSTVNDARLSWRCCPLQTGLHVPV